MDWIFSFIQCVLQHCFICRPSDSSVSEDAGIEPRTVATLPLTARRFNHSARSHPEGWYLWDEGFLFFWSQFAKPFAVMFPQSTGYLMDLKAHSLLRNSHHTTVSYRGFISFSYTWWLESFLCMVWSIVNVLETEGHKGTVKRSFKIVHYFYVHFLLINSCLQVVKSVPK